MSFAIALKTIAAETDETLGRLLPPEGGPAARLARAMRYAALGEGKRLRPFFVVETAALFGIERSYALHAAGALECVHSYSLVHDDLPVMDDDDLRRGKPTVHKAFDEATAILAGDALLTLAFQILARPEAHPNPRVRCELIAELAKAAGAQGMVGGQMLDLAAEASASHDYKEIARIQNLKTGALFRFACIAGAILSGALPEHRTALERYGDLVGLAFQIADDVLDVEANPASLGKATGKDRAKGKATFVQLLGLEAAKAKAADLVDQAIEAISPFGARATILREAAQFVISRTH